MKNENEITRRRFILHAATLLALGRAVRLLPEIGPSRRRGNVSVHRAMFYRVRGIGTHLGAGGK